MYACIFYDVYDKGILYAQHQMRKTVSALEGVREFICASSKRDLPPLLLQSNCTMSAFGRCFPSDNIWCQLMTIYFRTDFSQIFTTNYFIGFMKF